MELDLQHLESIDIATAAILQQMEKDPTDRTLADKAARLLTDYHDTLAHFMAHGDEMTTATHH